MSVAYRLVMYFYSVIVSNIPTSGSVLVKAFGSEVRPTSQDSAHSFSPAGPRLLCFFSEAVFHFSSGLLNFSQRFFFYARHSYPAL